jgi:riboflavin kinase/FMN adenylyltransferase
MPPLVRLGYDDSPPKSFQQGVATIGNFDGVHLGHRALLAEVQTLAQQLGTHPVVVTFDPHPMKLLNPERYQLPLTTIEQRVSLLKSLGIEHVVCLQTKPELLALSAEYFFETVIQRLHIRGLVEGYDFHFGHQRKGNNELLSRLCAQNQIPFRVVSAVGLSAESEPISTSRIRSQIQQGQVAEAAKGLGRFFSSEGIVTEGAKRGRLLGFPTANLNQIQTVLPREGVYLVRVTQHQTRFWGAANIGPNPTFNELNQKFEVHLLDYSGDLYGRPIVIEWIDRLRDTQKFSSVSELQHQLHKDIQEIRQRTQGLKL